MKIYTIYKATNIINQKVYIGFDSNWPNRKCVHKSASKKQDNKFYRVIRKYGFDNFLWEIIYQSENRDQTLKEYEPLFIKEYDSFKNGYNSTLGGEGTFGLIFSEEARARISKGNQIPKPQTKEHVYNRIQSMLRNNKPRFMTEETKIKISEANKGKPKPFSEEHIKNLKCHQNNKTIIVCPYCGKEGQLPNMKRWHFDNCKLCP